MNEIFFAGINYRLVMKKKSMLGNIQKFLNVKDSKLNQINLYFIIILILIDVTGVMNLWGENVYRRFLHHFQNSNYNKNKKPWITFPDNTLNQDEIKFLLQAGSTEKNNCFNKIRNTSLGSNYSSKCSLYYDDFDRETQIELDKIGNRLRLDFEKIIGKKLYLGTSNFRCCILRYEGIDAKFDLHYDTEEKNCYRCIYMFHKKGTEPPFCYFDENGKMIKKKLDVGKGLFFQGTRTYHGVEKSNDPHMHRYVVGWQYSTDLNVKTKTLCSEMRSKKTGSLIAMLLPYFILMNLLLYIIQTVSPSIRGSKSSISILVLVTLITLVVAMKLPNILPISIGTNLNTTWSQSIYFLVLCLVSCIISPWNGLILFNYILLTDMFLPASIVKKSLLRIGHS